MVSAADAAGTVVVVVHSNSYPRFGSGIVVPDYALVLANRAGRGFTPEPGHPNFPDVAGARAPRCTPGWCPTPAGTPRWAGGTPGGANQLPWNAQSMSRLLAGEERPGMLVTAPLWEWMPDDDGLRVEAGFAAGDVDALAEQARRVVDGPPSGAASRPSRWCGCPSPARHGKPPPTLAPSASPSASEPQAVDRERQRPVDGRGRSRAAPAGRASRRRASGAGRPPRRRRPLPHSRPRRCRSGSTGTCRAPCRSDRSARRPACWRPGRASSPCRRTPRRSRRWRSAGQQHPGEPGREQDEPGAPGAGSAPIRSALAPPRTLATIDSRRPTISMRGGTAAVMPQLSTANVVRNGIAPYWSTASTLPTAVGRLNTSPIGTRLAGVAGRGPRSTQSRRAPRRGTARRRSRTACASRRWRPARRARRPSSSRR